jgi:hypothetical protein
MLYKSFEIIEFANNLPTIDLNTLITLESFLFLQGDCLVQARYGLEGLGF